MSALDRGVAIHRLLEAVRKLDAAIVKAVDLGLDVSIIETARIELGDRVYPRYGVHVEHRSTAAAVFGTRITTIEGG